MPVLKSNNLSNKLVSVNGHFPNTDIINPSIKFYLNKDSKHSILVNFKSTQVSSESQNIGLSFGKYYTFVSINFMRLELI